MWEFHFREGSRGGVRVPVMDSDAARGDGEDGSGKERGMERAEHGNGLYGDYLHRVENMPIMGVREKVVGEGCLGLMGLCCRCGEVTYLSMIPSGCLFWAQPAREGQGH